MLKPLLSHLRRTGQLPCTARHRSGFSLLERPLSDIVAVTMPCFGTTERTRTNAQRLCEALSVTLQHVDITQTVRSNFADIDQDEARHDVTYENTQARVRTLVLMNLANRLGGLVIGTGDLSELALAGPPITATI